VVGRADGSGTSPHDLRRLQVGRGPPNSCSGSRRLLAAPWRLTDDPPRQVADRAAVPFHCSRRTPTAWWTTTWCWTCCRAWPAPTSPAACPSASPTARCGRSCSSCQHATRSFECPTFRRHLPASLTYGQVRAMLRGSYTCTHFGMPPDAECTLICPPPARQPHLRPGAGALLASGTPCTCSLASC
jgi:hypothetical protein